jgi:uncharacterized membrane protein (UPF0127 family)
MSKKFETPLIVKNVTRNHILVSRGSVAANFWTRLKGLMGSSPLEKGEALLISPSNSVHTHFMRYALDILYINDNYQVVAMDEKMKPWRMGRIHRQARHVLELPAGLIETTQTSIGDQLEINGKTKSINP